MSKAAISRQRILDAGLQLASGDGLAAVGIRPVAKRLGIPHSLVRYYFSDVEALRSAVADQAVKTCNGPVIAHLIVSRHPSIQDMPQAMRNRYLLEYLLEL